VEGKYPPDLYLSIKNTFRELMFSVLIVLRKLKTGGAPTCAMYLNSIILLARLLCNSFLPTPATLLRSSGAEDLCKRTSGRVVHVCAGSIDEFLRGSGSSAAGAVPIEEAAVGGNATEWMVMHKIGILR
jgi:hypothetical protein